MLPLDGADNNMKKHIQRHLVSTQLLNNNAHNHNMINIILYTNKRSGAASPAAYHKRPSRHYHVTSRAVSAIILNNNHVHSVSLCTQNCYFLAFWTLN